MSYLKNEKSNFMPIFMALSIVAVVGFGLMFFMFGKTADEATGEQTGTPAPAPAAVQSMSKESHTHV
ncbi:MAG TPA: hypothetical protein V6C76_17815 [Drouetiella sp.]